MTTKVSTHNFSDTFYAKLATPVISSITNDAGRAEINVAGGDTGTITGSNFINGATLYIDGNVVTPNSITGTSIKFAFPSYTVGQHTIEYVVVTPYGRVAKKSTIVVAGTTPPTWVTAAGSLGNGYPTIPITPITLQAYGLGTLSYNITSGSLPSGLSLSTSGVISGTPSGAVVSTFTVTVFDIYGGSSNRQFSYQVGEILSSNEAVVTTSGGYKYFTFNTSGTLNLVSTSLTIDYLVVAGGGGGGKNNYTNSPRGAGGGGGGGYRYGTVLLSPGSYPIVVGGGGAGATGTGTDGSNGSVSSFNSIQSAGGGGGGGSNTAGSPTVGIAGGSGGGSSHDIKAGGAGNTPAVTPSQGNAGGSSTSTSSPYYGSGGGGAGAAGGPGGATAGYGGDGAMWSNSTYYAGGGAGRGSTVAGLGGGGLNNTAGTVNTGGGGGGGQLVDGGAGGSGIVIIRIAI